MRLEFVNMKHYVHFRHSHSPLINNLINNNYFHLSTETSHIDGRPVPRTASKCLKEGSILC